VSCGALQPPPARPDPFALFGLAPRWHLDLHALDARWKQLARKVHPDRFAGRPPGERRLALAWTAAMNESRRTLRDPMRRAWLLATGASHPPERAANLDPAFLAEVFSWREADEEEPGAFERLSGAARRATADALDSTFTAWEEGRGDLSGVPAILFRMNTLAGHAPAES
jgi:molecular chaperone HscB